MTKVKICGITNYEDVQKAAYYGAWAVGFVFHKKSPRYISPSKARKLVDSLPPFITPVGVFVDQKERAIKEICKVTHINTVQFHGNEDTIFCKRFQDYKIIKAFRVDVMFDPNKVNKYKVDAYLFDAYQENVPGGTGKTFNWDLIKDQKFIRPVMLSGGLNPDNVGKAIDDVNPYALDISSGLEKSPGVKDPKLIRAFFDSIKSKQK